MRGESTDQALLMRLHRPRTCSDVVLRARLFERLESNVANALTLIAAPAGFGKTTLVTSWLDRMEAGEPSAEARARRSAWLALDAEANTPVLFVSALSAAIDRAFPGACTGVEQLLYAEQQAA